MNEQTVQRLLFGLLLLAVTAAFIWLIRGFLQPIFWAVAIGIVAYPMHLRLLAVVKHKASLASLISTLLVILVVIIPLTGLAAAVANEASALYDRLRSGEIDLEQVYRWTEEQLPVVVTWLQSVGIEPARIQEQISSSAVQISQLVASRALTIGQDTVRIAVFFVLMLYLLFFFLRDGARLLEGLVRALPLGDEREHHLLERFAEVSRATIKGTLVVGIVQGMIGGMAFYFIGIGAAVLWGVVMALLSIIPAVGPALVWLPAAVMLLTGGEVVSGIVLVLIGVLVIGLADNLLRPILVGRDTQMPDYLILLSTLGGLGAFGLAGIVIGPVIAAFFISFWEMAVEEFGGAGDEDESA